MRVEVNLPEPDPNQIGFTEVIPPKRIRGAADSLRGIRIGDGPEEIALHDLAHEPAIDKFGRVRAEDLSEPRSIEETTDETGAPKLCVGWIEPGPPENAVFIDGLRIPWVADRDRTTVILLNLRLSKPELEELRIGEIAPNEVRTGCVEQVEIQAREVDLLHVHALEENPQPGPLTGV